jgi:hypothetical protein
MDFTRNAELKLLISLLFLVSIKTNAYPEMIRHGYVNCMACHTSQQGGDLLSEYGKELSKELLSRHDSLFLNEVKDDNYWKIKTPEWLSLGSNVRFLQTLSESSAASKARFMIMQVDVDAAAHISDSFLFYTSVGRFEPTQPEAEWKDFIYSPRTWIQYNFLLNTDTSENLSLRVGRFYPSYGLHISEHAYVNRRNLEFNPGQERLAAELAYTNLNYQFVLTGINARATYQKFNSEKGYTLQASKVFGQNARLGFNVYRTSNNLNGLIEEKKMDGVFALVGWTPQFATLFQLDRLQTSQNKTGVVDFIKLNYEYVKGVQFFATQEFSNSDITLTDPRFEAYGVGVQYFPISNFDFFVTYKQQKETSQLNEFQNVMWFIAHMYF